MELYEFLITFNIMQDYVKQLRDISSEIDLIKYNFYPKWTVKKGIIKLITDFNASAELSEPQNKLNKEEGIFIKNGQIYFATEKFIIIAEPRIKAQVGYLDIYFQCHIDYIVSFSAEDFASNNFFFKNDKWISNSVVNILTTSRDIYKSIEPSTRIEIPNIGYPKKERERIQQKNRRMKNKHRSFVYNNMNISADKIPESAADSQIDFQNFEINFDNLNNFKFSENLINELCNFTAQ